jgi:hypothetical protein
MYYYCIYDDNMIKYYILLLINTRFVFVVMYHTIRYVVFCACSLNCNNIVCVVGSSSVVLRCGII